MIAHAGFLDHAVLGLLIVVAVGGYAALWSRGRRRRVGEYWSFASAAVVMLVITSPPVERLTDHSFTWHMAQHLVLMAVVAPLLLLAHPMAVFSDALPAAAGTFRRAGLAAVGRRVGAVPRTLIALLLLFGVHAGNLYDAALGHRLLHDVQHLAFVAGGSLLWSIAIGSGSRRAPQKIAAAFGASGALTLLSLWIMALDAPLSDRYARRSGVTAALDDQRTGAALMWVGMVSLTVPLLLVVVWQWAATEQRIAERAEAIADRRAGVS
jgi:cytochrome c oxidase assembly factor CtaG